MLRSLIVVLSIGAIAVLCGAPPTARAEIDPLQSSWSLSCDFPEFLPLTFFLASNGNGPPLSACFGTGCERVSACITVSLVDDQPPYGPLVGVPRDMVRIGQSDPGLVWCPGLPVPNCADDESDANGEVRFTQAYRGSGSSTAIHIWVWSGGAWHALSGALPFHSVSVDVNCDGIVNLSDISLFAAPFFGGPYQERVDYCHDGIINGGDVTFLAMGFFATCD